MDRKGCIRSEIDLGQNDPDRFRYERKAAASPPGLVSTHPAMAFTGGGFLGGGWTGGASSGFRCGGISFGGLLMISGYFTGGSSSGAVCSLWTTA